MSSIPSRKFILKLCLLGDGAVGKTSLVRRYVYDAFDDKYLMSFGTKVSKKTVLLEETQVDLMIWDILGQKTHESLHGAYYRGAAGALAVCDFTRKSTMESLTTWIESFRGVVGNMPVIILANKNDLQKTYSNEELDAFGAALGCETLETSAKTGENVEKAFEVISRNMVGGAK